ncbi:MAG: 50S ribosomal protein L21 [Chloroflexi bacterium]|nr:MAG: 50S ribosomal protein L21 [Chloroflexota bacterium]
MIPGAPTTLFEMYAILEHGGHQYRVTTGDRLLVDRIPAEIGSTVTLEPVLMVVEGGAAEVGAGVSSASVTATVIAHRRGRKLRVFTYKPKKRRRRTMGYRSQLTELRVEEVRSGAAGTKPARAEAKKPAARADRARTPKGEGRGEPASGTAEAATAAEAEVEVPAGETPAAEPAAPKPARARAARPTPKPKSPARKAPEDASDGT